MFPGVLAPFVFWCHWMRHRKIHGCVGYKVCQSSELQIRGVNAASNSWPFYLPSDDLTLQVCADFSNI